MTVPEGFEDPSQEPATDPAAFVATCDWGGCNLPSTCWRWDDRFRIWLPVCTEHAPQDVPR